MPRTHFNGRSMGLLAARKKLHKHVGIPAIVVPESELREIQRKVRLADLVEGSNEATLEQAPKAFDVVRVDVPAHVLASAVLYLFVRHPDAHVVIGLIFVRRDERDFLADGSPNKPAQRLCVRIADDLADDVAFALDSANHANLAVADSFSKLLRAFGLALLCALFDPVAIAIFAADVGLVNFDFTHKRGPFFVTHRRAQPRAHVPGRVIVRGEGVAVDRAVNFKRAATFLRDEHQVRDLEPNQQGLLSVLKDRVANHAETMIAARLTEPIERLGFQRIDLFLAATLRAGDAIRPTCGLKSEAAGFFVREATIKVA
jgi:hypothetical protein